MPTSQEMAAAFLIWANDEHLLSYKPRLARKVLIREAEPPVAPSEILSLLHAEIAPHELDAIRAAFRDNRIHYVGYADKRVVVAAAAKVPFERKLPRSTSSRIWLDFQNWKAPDILPARNAVRPSATRTSIAARHPCGTSVSTGSDISAGTFGCLVRDADGRLLGLSNNHVVGQCNDAILGLPIVAPGLLDVQAGGLDPFTLGHFDNLCQVTHGIPSNVATDANLDAALFTIRDEDAVTSMQQHFYDTPVIVTPSTADTVVEKVGRTTGHTTGLIDSIAVNGVAVRMEAFGFKGRVFFDRCIEIRGRSDFALRGDSGSLVVTEERDGKRAAVGVVFAVNVDRGITYAAPIQDILDRFNVQLVGGHHAAVHKGPTVGPP